jgi:flagellar basal body-associated protein FliL
METRILKRPILTVLLFIIIGLAFYLLWSREFSFESTQQIHPADKSDQIFPVYSLEPLVVELGGTYIQVIPADDGGKPRLGTRKKHLGLTMDLELTDKDAVGLLQKKKDQIISIITNVAATKKAKDIETVDGKTALGNEIVEKLNESLQKACVIRVLFKDFIVQ